MDEDAKTGPADASNAQTSAPIGAEKTGAPQTSGAPVSIPGSPSPLSTDIAKILQTVKLPERRDLSEKSATKPPRQIPISPVLSDNPTPAASIAQGTLAQAPDGATSPERPVVGMHTLKDDLQHVVREEKISYVRAAALEQDKRRSTPEEEVAPAHVQKKSTGIFFTVGLLLLLGFAALGGVYVVTQSKAAPLPAQQTDSLVFAESSIALPLDGLETKALRDQLGVARSALRSSLGSITRFVPTVTTGDDAITTRPVTLSEFMTALGAQPPADLVRALSDTFFLGVHTIDINAPVLVIPVTSYDHAFAGMLGWESHMNADLSPLFTPLSALTQGLDGLPTARTFTDVVMRNYDVRALKDYSGSIRLFYSFPTRNILIIAESPYTFPEILTRLQASRNL